LLEHFREELMASKKLTQRFVDTVRPGERDAYYWHAERIHQGVRLALKVTPTGRKVFLCKYRPVGGRRDVSRWMTLSATTLQTAEREAKRLFRQDADPARVRREERAAETVAEAIPMFLSELVGKKKPRTVYEWTRILGGTYIGVAHAGYVLPTLGTLRVRNVDETTIAALHRHVWNGSKAKRPVMANRVLGALGALFTWCESRGLRKRGTSPTKGVERFPEHERERYLTADELRQLSHALTTAETVGLPPAKKLRKASTNLPKLKHRPKNASEPRPADPSAVAAIRFLIFSGFREQEALSLRWDAIDFDRGMVTLAESKTDKSTRPLGAPALELLASRDRKEGDEYVFPGAVPGAPRREVKRVWYAVRESAGLDSVRLHDLRHTVASFAASGGASLPMVAALLGHRDTKSTQRYAHLFEAARRGAADRMAGDIRAAMNGTPTRVTALRLAK
jgi:integrase